jgi:hypothetical protein
MEGFTVGGTQYNNMRAGSTTVRQGPPRASTTAYQRKLRPRCARHSGGNRTPSYPRSPNSGGRVRGGYGMRFTAAKANRGTESRCYPAPASAAFAAARPNLLCVCLGGPVVEKRKDTFTFFVSLAHALSRPAPRRAHGITHTNTHQRAAIAWKTTRGSSGSSQGGPCRSQTPSRG